MEDLLVCLGEEADDELVLGLLIQDLLGHLVISDELSMGREVCCVSVMTTMQPS